MLKNKYSLSNCKKLENMGQLDLLNSSGLDESILNAIGQMTPNFEYSSSADGEEAEYEDEENVEYEETDSIEAGGVPEQDLPKFRQLVRAKKLDYRAKYGKAHFGKQQKCTNVKYPCPTLKSPLKMCTKKVCVDVPKFVSGWRKEWRKFKQQGGLAQLKQQAKGASPVTTPVTTPVAQTTSGSSSQSGISKFKPKLIKNIKVENVSVGDSDSRSSDEVVEEKTSKDKMSDSGDDKIFGMPKNLFYVGLGLVALGGIYIYVKRKTN